MRRVTIDDFHDIRRVSSPELSPDGTNVAYVRREPDSDESYQSQIHIADLETGTSKRFTTPQEAASEPVWSPDGDQLAFVSSRGATERPQLWIAPTDGGEAEPVTAVAGGVSSIAWCPDGNKLAFLQEPTPEERREGYDLEAPPEYTAEEPDPRTITDVVYRQETAHRIARRDGPYYDGAISQVYTVGIPDGQTERVTDVDQSHYDLSWGSDSKLYYVRTAEALNDSLTFDICVYNFNNNSEEYVTETQIQPPTRNVIDATVDGNVAYFYEAHDEHLFPQAEIRVASHEDGTDVSVTDDIDRRPSDVPGVIWGPSGQKLYFGLNDRGSRKICVTKQPGFDDYKTVVSGTAVNGVAVSEDKIAFTQSEWDHPGDVFVTEGGTTERVTNVNDEYLIDRHVNEPEEIWFENDGVKVQGWVLTPTDFDPENTYPLLVQVHGGPPLMWTTSGTMWHEFQAFADMGYVVFWSNPRGSLGYGEEFMRAVVRNWGGPYYEDVMAGVDEVVQRPYVDEDNMFITGGSFGGYMVGWTVGQTDRFNAAVAQRGLYDIKTMYGTSTVGKMVETHYGVHPWEEPELLWEHSPVAHVDSVTTPTMIIQSEHDYNTPRDDSEMFFRYLKKAGVDTELILYPREGHELSRSGEPAHVVDRLEQIAGWFEQYIDE